MQIKFHFKSIPQGYYPAFRYKLENQGYRVYDPIYSNGYVGVTYIKSQEIDDYVKKTLNKGDKDDPN